MNYSYLQMSSLDAKTNPESTNSEKKFQETDIFTYSYILYGIINQMCRKYK